MCNHVFHDSNIQFNSFVDKIGSTRSNVNLNRVNFSYTGFCDYCLFTHGNSKPRRSEKTRGTVQNLIAECYIIPNRGEHVIDKSTN